MSSPAHLTEFVESLRSQVFREAAHAREHIAKIWGAPLASRVLVGHAIEQVKVHSVQGQWVHLEIGATEALFREGDFLFFTETGDPGHHPRVELVLEDDRGSCFVCRIRSGRSFLDTGKIGVLDYGYFDVSEFMKQALDLALGTSKGRDKILPLLDPQSQIETKCVRGLDEEARRFAQDDGLNDAQTDALAMAWSTDLAALVQGPPGTGKTAVLAALAELAVRNGKKVLVTGLTHRGIDNAMNAIHRRSRKSGLDLKLARIGAPCAGSGNIANWETFADCPWADTGDGFVVGATPFCLMSDRLKGVEFDYSLFDEASQVHLPLAIMGMMGARKWVFFGDHQQLPPVLPTVPCQDKVQSSVFGFLQDRDFCVMLDTTYRLCDKLCEWPSEQFYEGKLQPHPSVAARRLELLGRSSGDAVLDPAHPLVHIEIDDPAATTSSNLEAEQVVRILEEAVRSGVKPQELAVVTPFRRQNRAIRNLLRVRLGVVSEAIAVDTVERMQGQEREMVVVSLTSGSDAFVERIAEFYFQPQRLNVAATRARCKLVFVGRSDWSELFERRPDLEEQGLKLNDLLSRATKVGMRKSGTLWLS